ncbi:phenylacetyl-CoA ligase [Desarmillaria tabescens]|uniref:Phenylacetyl-CoA ligase n=1 Tax=Armillaria tabescens TaxID=1929756 RepID=A0AA39NEZ5_ARMTA|nr:phenylacetyl-CoA ligase [Desarmillaria tabescens]KAK0464422.1 phenylacetyl-CoA ligase [Desarmillaria tabescens]
MTEIRTHVGLPAVPDNLSIPQFFLDVPHHVARPIEKEGTPWLIEDTSGQAIYLEEASVRSRTNALANGLKHQYDIGTTKKLAVKDYPMVIWAVHRIGGIISGANPDYTAQELKYQLEISGAVLIVTHPDALDIAVSAAEAIDGALLDRIVLLSARTPSDPTNSSYVTLDELVALGLSKPLTYIEPKINGKTKLAFLSFSSGTTGKPKAVAIPHCSVITNVIQMAVHNRVNEEYTSWENRRYRPGDVAMCVLPLYHIYGLVLNLHFILFCGMSVVIVPKYNFIGMLDSIIRHRVTHLMLVPPQVVLLCKHPVVKQYKAKLQVVRMIMVGAAPLSGEVNQQLFELLPDAHIGQSYGMTETCTATSSWPVTRKRGTSGSGGQLLPGVAAKVVKSDGSLANYGEPGELVIWSPSNALRYQNDAQASKDTFIDGWIRTGDEVKIDKNAELWILDRMKEIMKVRGFQVAPAELEGCILDHPDVSDACVVGFPDEYSGEVPLAFVVLTEEASSKVLERGPQIKDSIIKHVASNKVNYKHLKGGVEFISAIPKNPSGKLLRRVLRQHASSLRKKEAKM